MYTPRLSYITLLLAINGTAIRTIGQHLTVISQIYVWSFHPCKVRGPVTDYPGSWRAHSRTNCDPLRSWFSNGYPRLQYSGNRCYYFKSTPRISHSNHRSPLHFCDTKPFWFPAVLYCLIEYLSSLHVALYCANGRIVQKLGFEAKFSEFKIQNIVGSCFVFFLLRGLLPWLLNSKLECC